MKVLFFDSWTVGIHNFLPIAAKLREYGVDCLLVHRGSWGDEPNRPSEEIIEGLLCRDIRYYNTRFIHKVLAKEKPDAVVILTTRTFLDRAVILSARSLGIRSFYLMHGIVFVGEKREGDMEGTSDTLRGKRWSQMRKYLHRILPNYYYSGFKLSPLFLISLSPYKIIWNTFSEPAKYYWSPPPSRELQCDQALVWANIYRDHFHKTCGYALKDIEVVGHPPLDLVADIMQNPPNAMQEKSFLAENNIPQDKKIVVYLESPAVETGIKGWTLETRLSHFDEIIEAVGSAGRHLLVKLHPTSETKSLEKYNNDKRVQFIRSIDLPLLLSLSESVIGFMSSTLDIAIVLGKPIFTPTWGICASLPDDYLRNGVVVAASTVNELITSLQNPSQISAQLKDERRNYINHFITFTDGNAINRICDALLAS